MSTPEAALAASRKSRPAEIVAAAASDTGYTVDELRASGRDREIMAARRIVARRLREQGWPYADIAMALGRGDHSTGRNLVHPRRGREPWAHLDGDVA